MGLHVIYGEGGYDPSKPGDNIIEQHDAPDAVASPADDARAVIEAVRDPDRATPSIQKRLAALEALAVPPVEGGDA